MAGRRGAEEVLLLAAVSESHLLEGAGEHELAAEAARRATVNADAQLLSRTSGSVLIDDKLRGRKEELRRKNYPCLLLDVER